MNILDIGNNKTKCQHFTPEKIADEMLDLAGHCISRKFWFVVQSNN